MNKIEEVTKLLGVLGKLLRSVIKYITDKILGWFLDALDLVESMLRDIESDIDEKLKQYE